MLDIRPVDAAIYFNQLEIFNYLVDDCYAKRGEKMGSATSVNGIKVLIPTLWLAITNYLARGEEDVQAREAAAAGGKEYKSPAGQILKCVRENW